MSDRPVPGEPHRAVRSEARPSEPIGKARIEAFSDGVIAVAITLLALDLHVPNPSSTPSLAHALGQQWPNYVAYVVSFLTIGIIWINHHAMLRRVVSVDHSILVLNVLLLLSIVVLPFSTSLMAEYLQAAHGEQLAAVVYGGSFLLMSLLFVVLQRHLLVTKRHLLDERVTPEVRRSVLRRNAAGVAPYALATAGGVLTPYLTLAVCAALAVFFALPATTADVWRRPRRLTATAPQPVTTRRNPSASCPSGQPALAAASAAHSRRRLASEPSRSTSWLT